MNTVQNEESTMVWKMCRTALAIILFSFALCDFAPMSATRA